MISIGYCCSSTVFMENLQYTFLAITLCNVFVIYVTDSIFIVLIGFDCCYNVFLRYKTLKMKKQNPDLLDQQIDALQRFALCDVVEFHTPLGFILVFIRASMDQTLSFSATLSIATGATVRSKCKSSVEENRTSLFIRFLEYSDSCYSFTVRMQNKSVASFVQIQREFFKLFLFIRGYILRCLL